MANAHYTAPGRGTPLEMTDGTHTVKAAAEHSGGAFEVFEVTAPGGPTAPLHVSPWHCALYVLEGRVVVRTGSEEIELDPGATLTLPAGLSYTFAVPGDFARFLAVTSGDGAGRFFADFARTVPGDRPLPEIIPHIVAVAERHGVSLDG